MRMCGERVRWSQGFLVRVAVLFGWFASQAAIVEPRPARLLIVPAASANPETLHAFHRSQGVEVLRSYPDWQGLQVVQTPSARRLDVLVSAYRRSSLVRSVETDQDVRLTAVPNDPAFVAGTQWALHNTGQNGGVADADIDAPEAWVVQPDAHQTIVAIVDSGIWDTHEDLAEALWVNAGEIPGNGLDDDGNGVVDDVHGFNAVTGTGAVRDVAGHGTHVAGVIGAVANNLKGITGAAPGVRLMACRFVGPSGSGAVSDAVACLDYARRMGAHVVNASWVVTNASPALELAVERLRDAGIVLVAGAGNDGADNDHADYFPANYPFEHVLSVMATDALDQPWSRSNYGAQRVQLAAPGVDIYSTFFIGNNNYLSMSGTSQAAAFTSAAAALVRAAFPKDTAVEIADRVRYSADPLAVLAGRCLTGARLNLLSAVEPQPASVWPQVPLHTLAFTRVPPAGAAGVQRFVVFNRTEQPRDWSVRTSEPWLEAEVGSDRLAPHTRAVAPVRFVSGVADLPSGQYTNRVIVELTAPAERIEIPWVLRLVRPAQVQFTPQPAGGFQLGITGEPGATYIVEASDSLTSWRTVSTHTLSATGNLPSVLTDFVLKRRQYYRMRLVVQ